MGNLIFISTLSEEDKEAARDVLITSYEQYRDSFKSQEAFNNYLLDIKKSLDNPKIEKVLIAKDDNQAVLGTLQIYANSEEAYGRPELNIQTPIVRLLGVHPSARGKGVARKLLQESIEYAKQKGAKSLYLHTGEIMKDAIRLYERFGFQRDFEKEFGNRGNLVMCYRFDIE